MAKPQRVRSNKKIVWENEKKQVWLVDGKLQTYDGTWEEADGQLAAYDHDWENLSSSDELEVYDSADATEIGTVEDYQGGGEIYLSNKVTVYGLSIEEVEGTNYYSYAIGLFSRGDPYTDGEFIRIGVSGASENEYLSGVASFEVSPTFPSQEGATTIAHQLQGLTVKQFYDIFLSDLGISVEAECQGNMYHDMVLAADKVYKNPSDTTPFDTQLTAYLNARECAVQYPIKEIFYVHHLGDTITISYMGYEDDVVSVADVIGLAGLHTGFNNIDKYKLVQIDGISNEIGGSPIETVTIHEGTQDLYILGKELIITSNTDAPTGGNITADGEGGYYITFPQDNSDTWDVYFDIFNLYTGVKIDGYLGFYGGVLHYSNGEYDFTKRTFELDNGDNIGDMLTPLLNKLDGLIYTQIDLATINAILSDNAMTLYDSVYLLKGLDYGLFSYDSHDLYKSLEFKRSSQTRRFNAGEGKNPIYGANKWWPANNSKYVEFKSDGEGRYMFRIKSGNWVSLSLTQDEKTYLDNIFSSQQSTKIVTQSFQDNMLVQFYTTGHARVDDFVDFYGIDFYTGTGGGWATYIWFNGNRYYLNVQEDGQGGVVAYATPSGAENVKNWIIACAEAIDLATYQAGDMSALNTKLRNRLINYVSNPVQTIGSPSEASVKIIMGKTNPQITFSYTPTDANEFDNISVVSDDEGVATVSNVNNNGNGTASFTIEQVAAGHCTVTYSLTTDPTQTYSISVTVTAGTPVETTSAPSANILSITPGTFSDVYMSYTPTNCTVQDMNNTITISNPTGFSSEYVWNAGDGSVSTFRITAANDGSLRAGGLTYQAAQDPYAKTIYLESGPSEPLVSLIAPGTTHYTVNRLEWTSFDFFVSPTNAFPAATELTMTYDNDKCYPYFVTRDTSTGAITIGYTPMGNSGESGFITISMTNDPTQTFTVTFDIA